MGRREGPKAESCAVAKGELFDHVVDYGHDSSFLDLYPHVWGNKVLVRIRGGACFAPSKDDVLARNAG
jgi:hypothetical protein